MSMFARRSMHLFMHVHAHYMPVSCRCMTVMCDQPTCSNYELVPGSCCEYTCPDDVSAEQPPMMFGEGVEDSCVDFVGREVAVGEFYQPDSDPCRTCVCKESVMADGTKMDA